MSRTLVVDGDHLRRLFLICKTICGKRPATFKQLQTRLRRSRRTLFRDLRALGEYGIEARLSDRGYVIHRSLAECRKRITDEHVSALKKLLDKCLK